MTIVALTILGVLFLWWFATGVIFYLDGLGRRTFPWTVGGASLILAISLAGLALTADETSVVGALVAFVAALGVWAWNEAVFLTGYVTGPNRRPARPGLTGWARFRAATASLLHHELALAASVVLVGALTLSGENAIGFWTIMVLWVMRLSAKANIFVGVPNPGEDFLPEHLRYLGGHFRKAPVGPVFVASTSVATGGLVLLLAVAARSDLSRAEIVGVTLVATTLALAIIEHWFLALPVDTARLWRWSLAGRADAGRSAPSRVSPGRVPRRVSMKV